MKKFMALFLSLVLTVCLAAPALAAGTAKYSITVKVVSVKVVSNHSVGNSWTHVATAMGKTLKAGKSCKATVKATDSISIVCTSTEKDSSPDIGTLTIPISISSLKMGTTTYTKTVTVVENKGRYKGNTAVWKYTVTVTKAKA